MNGKQKTGMIRKDSGKELKRIRMILILPNTIDQTTIQSSPLASRPGLIIAPSVIETRDLKIKQVIIFNKIKEKNEPY